MEVLIPWYNHIPIYKWIKSTCWFDNNLELTQCYSEIHSVYSGINYVSIKLKNKEVTDLQESTPQRGVFCHRHSLQLLAHGTNNKQMAFSQFCFGLNSLQTMYWLLPTSRWTIPITTTTLLTLVRCLWIRTRSCHTYREDRESHFRGRWVVLYLNKHSAMKKQGG